MAPDGIDDYSRQRVGSDPDTTPDTHQVGLVLNVRPSLEKVDVLCEVS